MKKTDVLAFFGSTTATALFLKISVAAVSKWGSIIPELQAMRLERLTSGALKYDEALHNQKAA